MSGYKYCIVPLCPNTTFTRPAKTFISVPTDWKLRKLWSLEMNVELSPTIETYCCEDHFELEKDMKDYALWKMLGGPVTLKKEVVPHVFNDQIKKKWGLFNIQSKNDAKKTARHKTKSETIGTNNQSYFQTVSHIDNGNPTIQLDFEVAVKTEYIQMNDTLCCTCLSVDRVLFPLANTPLSPDWVNIGLDVTNGSICWECQAMLRKIYRFREKAKLANYWMRFGLQENFGCLSNLSVSSKGTFDVKLDHDKQTSDVGLDHDKKTSDVRLDHDTQTSDVGLAHDKKTSDVRLDHDKKTSDVGLGHDKQTFDVRLDHDKQTSGIGLDHDKQFYLEEASIHSSDTESNVELINEELERAITHNPNSTVYEIKENAMCDLRKQEFESKIYKQAKYKCDTCILTFKSNSNLDRHMETCHNENNQFACELCQQNFEKENELILHKSNHYLLYGCLLCTFTHFHLSKLHEHVKRDDHTGRTYKCKFCDYEFNYSRERYTHERLIHNNEPIECEICKKLISRYYINNHMLSHKDTTYKCELCNKSFTRQDSFKKHRSRHFYVSTLEDCYCTKCKVQYNTSQAYRQHLRTSTRHIVAKHECELCKRKFATKNRLQSHIATVHLKQGPFPCDKCEKTYAKRSMLKYHIARIHDKNYVEPPRDKICDMCGKGFTSLVVLASHIRSHTGERPFKCGICEATFGYSGALYTHNKLVHKKIKRLTKKTTKKKVSS